MNKIKSLFIEKYEKVKLQEKTEDIYLDLFGQLQYEYLNHSLDILEDKHELSEKKFMGIALDFLEEIPLQILNEEGNNTCQDIIGFLFFCSKELKINNKEHLKKNNVKSYLKDYIFSSDDLYLGGFELHKTIIDLTYDDTKTFFQKAFFDFSDGVDYVLNDLKYDIYRLITVYKQQIEEKEKTNAEKNIMKRAHRDIDQFLKENKCSIIPIHQLGKVCVALVDTNELQEFRKDYEYKEYIPKHKHDLFQELKDRLYSIHGASIIALVQNNGSLVWTLNVRMRSNAILELKKINHLKEYLQYGKK